MKPFHPCLVLAIFLFSCSPHYYYVVRHGEKLPSTNGNTDPALTDEGLQRADTLRELLRSKRIAYVFSTSTSRTTHTAEPTATFFNLIIANYAPAPTPAFIDELRSLHKNALIIGHSNTVDDIVNKLYGQTVLPGDLPESEFDNLFIIKKKGGKMSFRRVKYGRPSL